MSILNEVERARGRARAESQSDRAWRDLSEEERKAIRDALFSGDVGPGKMSDVLRKNDVAISKHFLTQLMNRAGALA